MRKYDGNTGRYIHIPEQEPLRNVSPKEEVSGQDDGQRNHGAPPRPKQEPPPNQLGGGIQKFLSNLFSQGFETEDLLLFAVLFLMYQETKDKELLIIMGGMFLF